jgi:nuclear pore complex protein Nup210
MLHFGLVACSFSIIFRKFLLKLFFIEYLLTKANRSSPFLLVVNLPSQYHLWHVKNSSVAQVDSSLGVVHTLSLGFTDVVVEDTRVSGHQQVSSLRVVIPRTLFLYLVPVMDDSGHFHGITSIPSSEVWYVFPGQKYMVLAKAFAEGFDAREIFITEVLFA